MIPAMKKEYGVDFAAGVVASAANIGPIIPRRARIVCLYGGALFRSRPLRRDDSESRSRRNDGTRYVIARSELSD
jgi:hypothetical protein